MASGGKREGAGRPKGSHNKATAEIRKLAQKYAPDCIKELARLSKEAQSESARVSAIGMLLDRGYGKAPQPLDGDGDGGAITIVVDRPPRETREEWERRRTDELGMGSATRPANGSYNGRLVQ